jgi:hypothetical protein
MALAGPAERAQQFVAAHARGAALELGEVRFVEHLPRAGDTAAGIDIDHPGRAAERAVAYSSRSAPAGIA